MPNFRFILSKNITLKMLIVTLKMLLSSFDKFRPKSISFHPPCIRMIFTHAEEKGEERISDAVRRRRRGFMIY